VRVSCIGNIGPTADVVGGIEGPGARRYRASDYSAALSISASSARRSCTASATMHAVPLRALPTINAATALLGTRSWRASSAMVIRRARSISIPRNASWVLESVTDACESECVMYFGLGGYLATCQVCERFPRIIFQILDAP